MRSNFLFAALRAGSKELISDDLSADESSFLLESFFLLFLFIAFEYLFISRLPILTFIYRPEINDAESVFHTYGVYILAKDLY